MSFFFVKKKKASPHAPNACDEVSINNYLPNLLDSPKKKAFFLSGK